jgi:hypothetical protein
MDEVKLRNRASLLRGLCLPGTPALTSHVPLVRSSPCDSPWPCGVWMDRPRCHKEAQGAATQAAWHLRGRARRRRLPHPQVDGHHVAADAQERLDRAHHGAAGGVGDGASVLPVRRAPFGAAAVRRTSQLQPRLHAPYLASPSLPCAMSTVGRTGVADGFLMSTSTDSGAAPSATKMRTRIAVASFASCGRPGERGSASVQLRKHGTAITHPCVRAVWPWMRALSPRRTPRRAHPAP